MRKGERMTDPETVRRWFQQLPRMREKIQQQEERIVDLQCVATAER